MKKAKIDYTEPQLIDAIRRKDRMAAEALYDMYAAALYGVISRIVPGQEQAEDLLQESFVKIWNSFASYDEKKGRLFTWMVNIARHLAIDTLRSKEFRNLSRTDAMDENTDSLDEENYSEIHQDGVGIKDLITKLRPQDKQILDLVYFKGYTHVEVSDELQLPLGTVKSRLRSAIITLKTFFN